MATIQKLLTLKGVMTKPFSSYLIVKNDEILYYTHSFGEIGGLNPSQSAPLLSLLNYKKVIFTLIEDKSVPYNVYSCRSNGMSLPYKQVWTEDLIHELRTGALIMDLGTRIIGNKYEKKGAEEIFKTLRSASQRQKLSTLIASDFIQLLTLPPEIVLTSLSKVISRIWSFARDHSHIKYHNHSGNKFQDIKFDPNPNIYGNEYFLENFFRTTLNWFENQPVTIEIDRLNSAACKISFCIPFKEHMSSLMSYRLINHYFQYVAAYFNFRVYLTQSTLNFIMPVII